MQNELQSKTVTKTDKIPRTKTIARMGVFIALLIIGALISIPIPFSPVAITLQTLVIMLIAIAFKPGFAIATLLIYIAMGSMGIPVFSSFQNFSVYVRPSGGFVIGFVPATLFMTFSISLLEKKMPISTLLNKDTKQILKKRVAIKYTLLVAIAIIFTVIYMLIGAVWFMQVFSRFFSIDQVVVPFSAALLAVVVPFLPGEAMKILVAVLAYDKLVTFRYK